MRILENMAVKNWLPEVFKVGDYVMKLSIYSRRILGKVFQFGGLALIILKLYIFKVGVGLKSPPWS